MIRVDEGDSLALRKREQMQSQNARGGRIGTGARSMIVSIPEDEALLTEADIMRRNAVSRVSQVADDQDEQVEFQNTSGPAASKNAVKKKVSGKKNTISDREIDSLVSGEAIDFVLNNMDLELDDALARTSSNKVASVSTDREESAVRMSAGSSSVGRSKASAASASSSRSGPRAGMSSRQVSGASAASSST